MSETEKIELALMKDLTGLAKNLDSPSMEIVYSAGHDLVEIGICRTMLPKAMSLLDTNDLFIRKLVYRLAGQNAFGNYIPVLFEKLNDINPAEREQVLHAIEERFANYGAPLSKEEQKNWIESLEKIGIEHQPTVVGIMSYFSKYGYNWFRNLIKNKIQLLKPGSLPNIKSFSKKDQIKIIKLLIDESSKKRMDLLPYICDIVDQKTVRYLDTFLHNPDWKDRALIAEALGRVGITTSSGIVMEIIADPDWQVKKRLLETINIQASKFASILRILGYVLTDSRSAIRNAAERLLLKLGAVECEGNSLKAQREKIEKKYRSQLLHAAPNNQDIDSMWLGVETKHPDVIPIIDETEESEFEGVSLSDIESSEENIAESESGGRLDLLSALMSAKKQVVDTEEKSGSMISEITGDDVDDSISMAGQLIHILKKLSNEKGKDVDIDLLEEKALENGFSESDFHDVIAQLEKEGTIYRSSKGTISYVDIDF